MTTAFTRMGLLWGVTGSSATMSHMYSMYLEGRRQAGSRVLHTQPTAIIHVLHVQPTRYLTCMFLVSGAHQDINLISITCKHFT